MFHRMKMLESLTDSAGGWTVLWVLIRCCFWCRWGQQLCHEKLLWNTLILVLIASVGLFLVISHINVFCFMPPFFRIGGESLAVAQNTYAVSWFKGKELNLVFGLQLSMARIVSFKLCSSNSWTLTGVACLCCWWLMFQVLFYLSLTDIYK